MEGDRRDRRRDGGGGPPARMFTFVEEHGRHLAHLHALGDVKIVRGTAGTFCGRQRSINYRKNVTYYISIAI